MTKLYLSVRGAVPGFGPAPGAHGEQRHSNRLSSSFTWLSRIGLAALVSCSLMACSGGSSSGSGTTADRSTQNTTASDSSSSGTPNLSPRDSADIKAVAGKVYFRERQYPKVYREPLQFITSVGGKKLATLVTMPADADGKPATGPFPVVLVQAAYNINLMNTIFKGVPGNAMMGVSDPFLVQRGYIMVAVDAMGTGASEGGWELLGENEQEGFADVVDWVQKQPWFDGNLGLAGVSYMAISSLFAAERRPDSVQAIFASLPMGDAQRGTVGVGGMINGVFMSTWMSITEVLSTQNLLTEIANPNYMSQLMDTTKEHVDQNQLYYLPMINAALDGAPEYTYDGDFWRLRSPIEHIDKIRAPTFILGCLDDIFQRDEPLLYERLKKNGVDTRLVIYNGTHIVNFLTQHIGDDQVPPVDYLMLQWFDKYLKGMDTGTENIPPVVQYVKNYPTASTPQQYQNDHFVTASDWPNPQATAQRWYLHGDDMSLSKAAPETDEQTHTMTHPEDPTGGAYEHDGLLLFNLTINDGTKCSRSFEQWSLGLVLPQTCYWNDKVSKQQSVNFDSAPMAEDYYINGPIEADIWIDSTVPETVVSVKVEDVSKYGVQPITEGQLVASGRAVDTSRSRFLDGQMIQPYHYFTEDRSTPLEPGQVVKMQIEIFPTSVVIPKGHKLRISISPSNQAEGMLNYQRQAMAAGGITTIYNSPEYPSSVVLPIVPVSALN